MPLVVPKSAPLVQCVLSSSRLELSQIVILPHQAVQSQVSYLVVRQHLLGWHRATLLRAKPELQPLVHLTDFLQGFILLV